MSFVLKTLGAGVLFVLLAIGAAVADLASTTAGSSSA